MTPQNAPLAELPMKPSGNGSSTSGWTHFSMNGCANRCLRRCLPIMPVPAERRLNSAEALAGSLRTAGTGTQEPLWDKLDKLSMPVLVITGELDHKFTEIAQRFVACITDCEHVVIPAVGHAVHLEAPAATASAIVSWWNRVS
jgi:pimeloyl-ACP methyl ester carboxylesterase